MSIFFVLENLAPPPFSFVSTNAQPWNRHPFQYKKFKLNLQQQVDTTYDNVDTEEEWESKGNDEMAKKSIQQIRKCEVQV
jgi:hypothetical protein